MLYKGSHYNYIIGNNSACLVMNMKTGKQLKIADTCVEDVQIALDTNPHEIDETMYDCFIKSGMLVPEDVDEARLLELQYGILLSKNFRTFSSTFMLIYSGCLYSKQ